MVAKSPASLMLLTALLALPCITLGAEMKKASSSPAGGKGAIEAKLSKAALLVGSDASKSSAKQVWTMTADEGAVASIELSDAQTLFVDASLVDASGAPFAPQTAAIVLKLVDAKAEVPVGVSATRTIYFPQATKSGQLSLALQVGNKKQVHPIDGRYSVALAIGDSRLKRQLYRPLGFLDLKFTTRLRTVQLPMGGDGYTATVTKAVSPSEAVFYPQPIIEHMFRPEEKRANPVISFVALILTTVVPLVGLLAAWGAFGANAALYPRTGSASLTAAAFWALLCGCFFLLFLFWWSLNLIQTLTLLVPLAAATAFVGSAALHNARLARTKTDKAE